MDSCSTVQLSSAVVFGRDIALDMVLLCYENNGLSALHFIYTALWCMYPDSLQVLPTRRPSNLGGWKIKLRGPVDEHCTLINNCCFAALYREGRL